MKTNRIPKIIDTAVKLLWISLVFVTIRSIFDIYSSGNYNVGSMEAYIIGSALAIPLIGIAAWIISMISKGKSWARTTYLVLFIVKFPESIIGFVMALSINPLVSLLHFGEILFPVIAFTLLFRSKSSKWFK